MRKGQYLALESVLTLSMGLAVAVGAITVFNDYRSNVLSTGEEKQIQIVKSRLVSSIQTLDEADSGHLTVELPNNIGGKSYEVFMGEQIKITEGGETHTISTNGINERYKLQGSAPGGTVKVFKNGNKFILRSN